MKISIKWFIFCLFIVSCDESLIDKSNNEGLAYKQTITINNIPKATLTFFDVEDSRCPKDVQCIWAGNATIDLELNGINTEGKVTKHIAMCLGDCRVPRKTTGFREIDTLITSFADQRYRFILKKVTANPRPDTVSTTPVKSHYTIDLQVESLE